MNEADGTERPGWVLPAIVLAQLLATSVWFAPNAVIGQLNMLWARTGGEGAVTAAVQLGFISGTLIYAVLALADRHPPRHVFLVSAMCAAACNAGVLLFPSHYLPVLAIRFGAGFFLAGVYPVGMKMAASWYRGGLGRALGFLTAALVLGTATPHLVRALGASWDWRVVVVATSAAAVLAGLLASRVPEGPCLQGVGPLRFRAVLAAFRVPNFRAAASGYFGHMWELYAFWAFAPAWLVAQGTLSGQSSLWSFGVIAAGALGCAGGGLLVRHLGGGRLALGQLAISGLCCALSPVLFLAPPWLFGAYLLLWGMAVAGDSPQFSALSARNAPTHLVGSALTLVNCIGFAITILSLNLLEWLRAVVDPRYLLLPLALGPLLGLIAGRRLLRLG